MIRNMLPTAGLALAMLALGGCGGGGGDGAAPASTTANVPVTVIDGPLRNALVCLDRNQNDACDSGEPAGRTAADGTVTLEVPLADAGKFPVLAVVGTDAVDADHGKVETAFKLKAPADRPGLVSPLTTLVQQTIAATGVDSAAADVAVRRQLDTQASLFTNFTLAGAPEGERLATFARLLVVVAQVQSRALAAAEGTKAIDGVAIKAQDIERAIRQNLHQTLSALVMAAGDQRLAAAETPAARRRAFTAVADELAARSGLTATSLPTRVAIDRNPERVRPTGVAAASLLLLDDKGAGTWTRHVQTSSARQNTPGRDGAVQVLERRSSSVQNNVAEWGWGPAPGRQAEFHWNGSAWVQCALNQPGTRGAPDAAGQASYDRCDGAEQGVETRAGFDVSGRQILAVYQQVRDGGFENLTIAEPAESLGSAVFPAGSRLSYSVRTPTHNAPFYFPGLGSVAAVYPTRVAAGEREACNAAEAMYRFQLATTLAEMVRRNRGTPCIDEPDSGSGPRKERWAQSTASFMQVGTAPLGGSPGYYTANQVLRVGFGEDRKVTFYRCRQRASDGATLNCDVEGVGTYEIQEFGDAKLMFLRGQPALFASQPQERIFVERGGHVHTGLLIRGAPVRTAQLNLAAMDALQATLGLPVVDPESRIALTDASYQGAWSFDPPGQQRLYGLRTMLLTSDGRALCAPDGSRFFQPCRVSVQARSGAFTYEDDGGTGSGVMRFEEGTATFRYTPSGQAPVDLQGVRQ